MSRIGNEVRWAIRRIAAPLNHAMRRNLQMMMRSLRIGLVGVALSIAAACGGSGSAPVVELVGVSESRASEAIDVVQRVRDCDRPVRVVLNSSDNYSVDCEKDGFFFDAVRSHTVFCADGKWHFVAWADFSGTDQDCTPA